MKIERGEVFRVVSSICLQHLTYHSTNTGFVDVTKKNQKVSLVKDRELGMTIISSVGYLTVAEASAIQDIEICQDCCVIYGKPLNKCEHCQNHVFIS